MKTGNTGGSPAKLRGGIKAVGVQFSRIQKGEIYFIFLALKHTQTSNITMVPGTSLRDKKKTLPETKSVVLCWTSQTWNNMNSQSASHVNLDQTSCVPKITSTTTATAQLPKRSLPKSTINQIPIIPECQKFRFWRHLEVKVKVIKLHDESVREPKLLPSHRAVV